MKWTIQLALLATTSLIPLSSTLAQQLATVNIPFDFTVQHRILPPGTYRVESLGDKVIQLRSKDGKFHELTLVTLTGRVGGEGGKLIFHRYGDQYFLCKVQIASDPVGMELPTTKAEKRAQYDEAAIRNDSTAIVAMK